MKNRAIQQINVPSLTKSGKAWLSWAIDPFHDDVSTNIDGMPDNSGNATIIRTFNKFKNIVWAGGAGLKWDLWIFTLPVQDQSNTLFATRQLTGAVHVGTMAPIQTGTVNIWSWPSTYPDPFTAHAAGDLFTDFIIGDTTNAAGDITLSRIIAGGFEVCNDTADLYKDGHVISYSTPSSRSRDYGDIADENGAVHYGNYPIFVSRGHPITEEEGRAIKNCVSWKAAEGCYTPFRINVKENNFEQVNYITTLFESSRSESAGVDTNLYIAMINAAGAPYEGQAVKYSALDNVGSWFSGLNAASTFTVNVRIITETAPINNVGLLSYNPTYTPNDELSLSLYRQALMHLPPSVTYDENADASFWAKALGVISKVAAPIGVMVGQPAIGSAVAAASAAAAKAVEKRIEAKLESKVAGIKRTVEKKTNAMPSRATQPQRPQPKRK